MPLCGHFMPFKSAFLIALAAGLFPSVALAAFEQCGKASWYQLTSITASGERADPDKMTAAHRTLPFGTIVTVENVDNGKTVDLRINDRGPFIKGRVIDITRAAAQKLDFIRRGTARVRVTAETKTHANTYTCKN